LEHNTQQEPTTHQVQFTGDAQTFFGIWIVNLMLSAVTFGIYSAWAKVRTKRYFAQNTLIDERRFDYHATGKQIFIGRLIVGAVYVVFNILGAVAPILGIVLAFLFVFAMPWLINRSIAFNARMTSFSGLRFGFTGSYWRALLVYFIYPILSMFTLYLTFPFVARAQHRYYADHHRIGATEFDFESTIGPFYKAFLLAIGWTLLVLFVGGGLLGVPALLLNGGLGFESGNELQDIIVASGLVLLVLIAILPASFIYQAFLRNAAYAGTTFGGLNGFTSTVRPLALLGIALTNALAIVISFGLMSPWARVRMARYMASNTYVHVTGSIDDFVGGEREKIGALGDAFTDLEGIDVDFAL
jgi:uncharacterized membrane protein YjgN (DUF898 family)